MTDNHSSKSGTPEKGILKAMIDLINELDPTKAFDSNEITKLLIERGLWNHRRPRTPERSINMYFSQNTNKNHNVFKRVGPNTYCLDLAYIPPYKPEESGNGCPDRRELITSRIVRDTEMANRLKALYGNRCQICGEQIQLLNDLYSEGHHLKPLGRPHNGPDIPENILVLCPNHHVMCDHAALPINRNELRMAPQHNIGDEFIAYHNKLHVLASS